MASGFDVGILSGLAKGLQGIGSLMTGMDITSSAADYSSGILNMSGQQALEAGQYSASVYRQAGKIAQDTTRYNLEIERYNNDRQNDAISRNMRDMFASNRAMMGSSGISFASGSYLSVQAAALDRMTSQAIQLNNATVQRKKMISYQGMLSEYDYENKARQSEYSGQVQKVNYENQAKQVQYQAELTNYQAEQQGTKGIFEGFTSLLGAIK